MGKKVLTAKERVLKKWPEAHCRQSLGKTVFYVWSTGLDIPHLLGEATTPRAAWADAAKRMEAK